FPNDDGTYSLLLNIGTPNAVGNLTFLDAPAVPGDGPDYSKLIHVADNLPDGPDVLFTVASMDTARNLFVTWVLDAGSANPGQPQPRRFLRDQHRPHRRGRDRLRRHLERADPAGLRTRQPATRGPRRRGRGDGRPAVVRAGPLRQACLRSVACACRWTFRSFRRRAPPGDRWHEQDRHG